MHTAIPSFWQAWQTAVTDSGGSKMHYSIRLRKTPMDTSLWRSRQRWQRNFPLLPVLLLPETGFWLSLVNLLYNSGSTYTWGAYSLGVFVWRDDVVVVEVCSGAQTVTISVSSKAMTLDKGKVWLYTIGTAVFRSSWDIIITLVVDVGESGGCGGH